MRRSGRGSDGNPSNVWRSMSEEKLAARLLLVAVDAFLEWLATSQQSHKHKVYDKERLQSCAHLGKLNASEQRLLCGYDHMSQAVMNTRARLSSL